MRRVRVTYLKTRLDGYGYSKVGGELSHYDGDLLAIVGLAERVVYVIENDDCEIKEESQLACVKITLLE